MYDGLVVLYGIVWMYEDVNISILFCYSFGKCLASSRLAFNERSFGTGILCILA